MKMRCLGYLIVVISFPLVSGLCSTCLQERCHDNGECIVGCVTGYVGKYCHIICPTKCVNNKCYIDRIKGTVTCLDGCEAGYCGAKCTRSCDEGCVTCNQQCGSCNVTLCPERRYGADCSQICSAKFDKCDGETGQCIICNRGYFGDKCTRECLDCFTREDDLADNCLSGCEKCRSEDACPVGFRGDLCELKCSTGCEEQKGCNRATGECSDGCVSGYHGLTCNNTCSEHCLSGRCDRSTGECSDGCVSGYHGLTCNNTCNGFCEGGLCNQYSGICTSGCISGYKTNLNMCVKNSNEESGTTVGIFVTIVIVCIVAASIMAVVIVRRCRSRSSKPRSERRENDPENLEHLLGTPVPAETSTNERLSCQKVATNARADIETFFKAVTQGKLVEVKRLLSSGVVDVNCRDKKGRTPVMRAAQYRQGAIFDFLVQSNCDVSAVSDTSNNVLYYACLGGSEYIVKMLLDKHKLDIECRGRFGRTPLMCAVEKGHMSVVKILKEKEADFNTVDDDNNNILHMACLGGHVDLVKYMLSLNITDIECREKFGRTPLMCAVEKGHMSVVKILKEKGADFNTVDDDNNNILHMACLGGHVDMVQYVLSLNITDIECRGKFGRTPLMCAVEKGHLSVVEMLKEKGADFKTVDRNISNILHVACIEGHLGMVKHLVSLEELRGFERRKNKDGRTPLQMAQVKGQ